MPPVGNVKSYKVQVDGLTSMDLTTFVESITINKLIPGNNYNFKVFAVADDNITQGNPAQISVVTNNSNAVLRIRMISSLLNIDTSEVQTMTLAQLKDILQVKLPDINFTLSWKRSKSV
ncbi:receptor-type tyrosine-protein phosphatase eta-like [Protopterus annectens]|uniref:receptor-type tyrosine-protein phosphatase eta-like n=1 Tax=Protopterus annectens TaxID=7888 RepID=UPI001CFAA8D3|nr:receptor-type tyrosine-protein phosphatase eta-like [Protopterus annectens]